MPIQDLANNQFFPTQSSQMLGFTPSVPEPEEETLRQRIYMFIIESIRIEDQTRGDKFLERFLNGPQAVWKIINDKILDLPKLWDATSVSAEQLKFLKHIVGWTSKFDEITDALNENTLRRLVIGSVPFWKTRGPEDSIEDILRLVTSARIRITNYFDLRWVLEERALGYEACCLEIGGETADERRFQVRIVDDGTLDRRLARNVIALCRPSNERIDVFYTTFLDEFTTDDDLSQWETQVGAPAVASGNLSMTGGGSEIIFANAQRLLDLKDYTLVCKIRGSSTFSSDGALGIDGFGVIFHRTSDFDLYSLTLDVVTKKIWLYTVVGGTRTLLASAKVEDGLSGFRVFDRLSPDAWYELVINVREVSPGSNQISVTLDGRSYFSAVTDGTQTQGTFGFYHGPLTTLQVDEVEVIPCPVQLEEIGINSR